MRLIPQVKSPLRNFSRSSFLQFVSITALLILTMLSPTAARPQQQGPLPPPSSGGGAPGTTSSSSSPAAAARSEVHDESEITNTPPTLPVEQIIAKFSQHETEFRKERDN